MTSSVNRPLGFPTAQRATRTAYLPGGSVLLTQYCSRDKMEKNEMGGTCSAYGGEERCIQGFGGETGGKEIIGETQA